MEEREWAVQTILVADDEPEITELIQAALGPRESWRFLVAHDGLTALTLAQAERPDLMFLDVVMPAMSGFEVCRQLKKDPETAAIPIILTTALTQESVKGGAPVMADGYLLKPFELATLVAAAESILG